MGNGRAVYVHKGQHHMSSDFCSSRSQFRAGCFAKSGLTPLPRTVLQWPSPLDLELAEPCSGLNLSAEAFCKAKALVFSVKRKCKQPPLRRRSRNQFASTYWYRTRSGAFVGLWGSLQRGTGRKAVLVVFQHGYLACLSSRFLQAGTHPEESRGRLLGF